MRKKDRKIRYILLICLMMLVVVGVTNYSTYMFVKHQQQQYYKEQFASYLKSQEEKEKLNVITTDNTIMNKASFRLDDKKMTNINKVMIVAHPDDETLWGGANIMHGGWLIVCLTNGNNVVRKKEFFNVMKNTGNYGIMLNYPDNPNHKKDNWSTVKSKITDDVRYIVRYKNWDQIVTHNPLGEYGHIQHLSTNMIVTNVCVEEKKTNQLYYFEKFRKLQYFQTNEMKVTLNEEQIEKKHELMMKYYPSQVKVYGLFKHMIPYETLISYNDWNFE